MDDAFDALSDVLQWAPVENSVESLAWLGCPMKCQKDVQKDVNTARECVECHGGEWGSLEGSILFTDRILYQNLRATNAICYEELGVKLET